MGYPVSKRQSHCFVSCLLILRYTVGDYGWDLRHMEIIPKQDVLLPRNITYLLSSFTFSVILFFNKNRPGRTFCCFDSLTSATHWRSRIRIHSLFLCHLISTSAAADSVQKIKSSIQI